jgi:hypothetical protein
MPWVPAVYLHPSASAFSFSQTGPNQQVNRFIFVHGLQHSTRDNLQDLECVLSE